MAMPYFPACLAVRAWRAAARGHSIINYNAASTIRDAAVLVLLSSNAMNYQC